MKSVARRSPQQHTAVVEPGVILGELDRETQAFGLATPLGINSTTGVAGLTLGGGGGNLGIVTKFTFRLQPVGPEELAGLVADPLAPAAPVLRHHRGFVDAAADRLSPSGWCCARRRRRSCPSRHTAPRLSSCRWSMSATWPEGERLIAPVRRFGAILGAAMGGLGLRARATRPSSSAWLPPGPPKASACK